MYESPYIKMAFALVIAAGAEAFIASFLVMFDESIRIPAVVIAVALAVASVVLYVAGVRDERRQRKRWDEMSAEDQLMRATVKQAVDRMVRHQR